MTLPTKLLTVFLLFIAVLIFTAWLRLPSLHFNNDILALFPHDSSSNQEQQIKNHAAEVFSQYAANKVLFLIGHENFDSAKSAAEIFSHTLSQSTIFKQIKTEVSSEAFEELASLYREHSPALLSEEVQTQLSTKAETFIQKRIRQLYTSPAFLSSEAFEADPLGTSDLFLQGNFSGATGPFHLEQQYLSLSANDLHYILVQAQLSDSVFSLSAQNAFSSQLSLAEQQVFNEFPNSQIQRDGAVFFALSGAEQAQSEISTVGLGSVIGIIILLIGVFLSFRVLSLCLMPTAIGIITGLLVCELVFAEVHLIALVFGASLIGVSIDYSFHFLSTRLVLKENWSPLRAIQELRWGLSLGVLTSASAYASFLFSGFPGFQQIAIFSAAGLIGAYITVLCFFPILFAKRAKRSAVFEVLRPRLLSYANTALTCAKNRICQFIFVCFFIGSLCVIFFKLVPQDDIRSMQSIEPALLDQHLQMKALTEQNIAQQFLLVKGVSQEQLLQNLEILHKELNTLSQNHYSLASWLPSEHSQYRNINLVKSTLLDSGRLTRFFEQMHFNRKAQARWLSHFEEAAPLTISNGLGKVQAVIDQPWYFEYSGDSYSIVILDNVIDASAIKHLAATKDELFWVDQIAQTNTMLETYRKRSSIVLAFAFIAVYILLSTRYGFRHAAAVILPPAFACTATCAALILFGQAISLFNIMALVLILGIGIDYSIFMRESKSDAGTCLFAISLSTITTILSFGLLALSATQAISSFGLTVLIGISLCFIFTPISNFHSPSLEHSPAATKKKVL